MRRSVFDDDSQDMLSTIMKEDWGPSTEESKTIFN